jgi:hypothetical protein
MREDLLDLIERIFEDDDWTVTVIPKKDDEPEAASASKGLWKATHSLLVVC